MENKSPKEYRDKSSMAINILTIRKVFVIQYIIVMQYFNKFDNFSVFIQYNI